MEKEYDEIYAVDFDGTLNLAEKYPLLGEPNDGLFEFLRARQQAGDKIILNTCREGTLLDEAVEYCRENGLEFDAVNDNLKENIERWKNNCRKIFADHYIDDKNMYFPVKRSRGMREIYSGTDGAVQDGSRQDYKEAAAIFFDKKE